MASEKLEMVDRQAEHWTLLRKSNGGPQRSLAIFIHGFWGDHLTTWGRLPEMLRDNAQSEAALRDWDFLFIGYRTCSMHSYLDIARLIATQWTNAAQGFPPFGVPYVRFALFGHSLGTLGIRQLLCAKTIHPNDMLSALHGVTLFGTPLNGSPLAWIAKVTGCDIVGALKPGNPQLRMLRSWNETVHPHFQWSKVKLVLGTEDKVVGSKYADLIEFSGDERPASVLNFDHKSLVKPKNWQSSSIRDQIVGALQV